MAEAQQPQYQRQVAHIVTVQDLLDGKFMPQEGWEPNYILMPWGDKIGRVHLVGTVIEYTNAMRMLIDDGSTSIELRSFDPLPNAQGLDVGDVIRVIGKPRMFNDKLYVAPEIIAKLPDKKWIELHQAILKRFARERSSIGHQPENVEHTDFSSETSQDDNSPLIDLIDDLDDGQGASVEEIINQFQAKLSVEKPKETVDRLLLHGEIFEIRPGFVKVLR